MSEDDAAFDVAILGAGFGGALLGTLLAARGLRTLILERRSGPGFAVGESTIPRTSMLLRLMAARHGVPELAELANFPAAGPTPHGIKRNFGFVYHREGQRQRPTEVYQTLVPEARHGAESHQLRREFDARLVELAQARGADVRWSTEVETLDFDADGVELVSAAGERWRARYLVDASGHRSQLAAQRGWRAPPGSLRTRSRALFTHMRGVAAYETTQDPAVDRPMPRPWSQGTLHHLFDGGWLWVIPFDNHPRAQHDLCSVGLCLDLDRHPPDERSAQAEFEACLRRFPSLAAQFAAARPVREWVSTGRLQYGATQTVGERCCLLSHAAGFVDALFSRGLANSALLVEALAWRLIAALADGDGDGDVSRRRFAYVEALQADLLANNDRLVACAYASWRHYDLWRAFVRVWTLGAYLDWVRLDRIHTDQQDGADESLWRRLEPATGRGSLCPGLPAYDALFERVACEVEAVRDRGADPARAAAAILEHIRRSPIVPPALQLDRPELLHDVLLEGQALPLFRWFRSEAPDELAALFFGARHGGG